MNFRSDPQTSAQNKTKHSARRGAVSLITILILAGILVEITAVALTTSFLSGEQGLGLKASYVAQYAARAGVNDVILRITRDRTFIPDTNPYTITVTGGSASVLVTRTTSGASHIQYAIASTGSSGLKKVKITSTVIIDDETGALSEPAIVESGI